MTRKVQLEQSSGEGTPKQKIDAEFEDAEWDLLVSFRDYTKELGETELMIFGGSGQLSVNYKQGEGISFSTKLPENDKVLALIHRLRPFVLQKEPTHFNRICNILARRISDRQFRKLLDVLKDNYSADQMSPLIITSNDVVINSEEILQRWLNAFEYHRDAEKRKQIEALHVIVPLEASRALFIMSLYDKARAIMALANIIGVVLGEKPGIPYCYEIRQKGDKT